MELYVSEFSKYVIAFLLIFYTYECFAVFRFEEEAQRKGIYLRQNLFMFLFHFSCFLVICFETGDITYLFFYAFQQIILYAAIVLYHMLYPKTNRLIINNMCMLLIIGFVILTRFGIEKALKQFIIVTGSLIIALIIPFFFHKFKFLKRLKWIYAAIGIAALSVVMILGQTTYGSKLSYSIAGLTFQPSEFVKIALIFFVVYVLMVFVASRNFLYVIAGLLGGSGAAYIAYRVFTHVQVRVQAWKDPWSVIDSAGYQITQSLFAISSGGWFGLGLFKGRPDDIPFVEADFIFSAIAEELGILIAVCLILICVSCFVMFMNISSGISDKFYQLTAFGLGVTYIFQVFLTIGGGSKFIPLTGVTLPLVSYGGSSVLTTLIMFAIIEGLHIVKQEEEEQKKREERKVRRKKKSVVIEMEEEDLPGDEIEEEE